MTVAVNDTIERYVIAGAGPYAYTWRIFNNTDLQVYALSTASPPVPSLLTYQTHYTVAGANDAGGGTITLTAAALALYTGFTLDIRANTPRNQPTSIRNQARFLPEIHEDAFDYLDRQIQDIGRLADASVRSPDNEPPLPMILPPVATRAGKYGAYDALGQPIASSGTGNDSALRADLASTISGADGSRLSGYRRTETGSVAQSVFNVLKRRVYIEDFGGVPGAGDNSAAFNAALAALVALGGGELCFATVGEWRMNVTIAAFNITLVGPGGKAEFDINCIRPFNIATGPALTWGDGVTDYRYCGMRNIHISGTNGTAGADVQSAKSASECLLIKGGMIGFKGLDCWAYNGIRTISLVPSLTNPVTGFRWTRGGARNDLTDSANARTIYGTTKGSGLSGGYYTDNVFESTKLNGPGGPTATLGYFAEFYDGGVGSLRGEFHNCYFDMRTDSVSPATVCHGILLNGNASLSGFGVNLDTGSAGAVAVETTQAVQDVGRFLIGEFRHAAQKFKFSGGVVVDLPNEAEWCTYQHRLNAPFMVGARGVSTVGGTNQYPTTVKWEMQGTTGPERLTGASLELTKDILIWGGNASQCGRITSVTGSGGLFLGATGTDQNVRLVPTGAGQVVCEGAYTRPNGDNTQDLGGAGNRWKVVYAGTGAINTSDERVKDEIEDIPAEWLEAWGDVQWQRFKFKDAIATKGDGARWHIGLIAQRVVKAFADRGLDATEIGLVCYEEWADEFEDVREEYELPDKDGQPAVHWRYTGEKRLVRAAGNLWSMRYEEALAMECAYLRSRLGT
jgi:Chaperone of endosialidase